MSSEDKKTADGKDKLRLAGPSPVPTPPPGLIGGSKPNKNNKDAKVGADGKSSSVAPGAFSVCDPAPSRGEAPSEGTKNQPEDPAVQIDESDPQSTKKSDEKSKTLLRLAPATAPEGAAVDESAVSSGRTKKSEEGKSKNLLRLAPAAAPEGAPVDESAAASSGRTNERGDDKFSNLLRHRVQPARASNDAPGDENNVSPSPNEEEDDGEALETNLVEAKIAKNVDVEALLDERLQQMVVDGAAAGVGVQREEEEDDDESNNSHVRRGNLPLLIFGGVVLVVVAVVAVVALLPQSSESNGATNQLASNTEPPTPAPSTRKPTQAPTSMPRSEKVRDILADYAPLDGEALTWLTEFDRWEPDDRDTNIEYLWLERYAMVDLYFTTNGPNWISQDNWLSDEPVCLWYFFNSALNDCPGPITELNLWVNGLTSSIPSSIGYLTQLKKLDLSANELASSIPSSIGNLIQLTLLDLAANQLTSSIPSSMGNLSKLTYVNLGGNQLTSNITSWIGSLIKLTTLTLGGNHQFASSIPSSIGSLTQLRELYLGGVLNQTATSIPSWIGNMTQLVALSLSDNQLNSSIPSWIGDLTQLTRLYLYNNRLTSSIPSSIGSLTQLTEMRLNDNNLSGSIPVLPSSVHPRPYRLCYLENNCFQNSTNGQAAGCWLTPSINCS